MNSAIYKKMERSDTITLGILAHFSHFRHFYFLNTAIGREMSF
jgi:hypothetical protein